MNRIGKILVAAFIAIAGCRGTSPVEARPQSSPGTPLPELLRRVEETMAAAKSVRIRCHCEQIVRLPSGREDRFTLEGTALLKDEAKVQLAFRGVDSAGDPRGVSVVSDGSRVMWRLGFSIPPQECPLPKEFRGTVQGLMGRLGLAFTSLLVAGRLQTDGDRMDLSGSPHVSDFKKGEEDATSASFSYRITDPAGKAIAAKLWYDKSSFRPVKRVVTREDGSQSLSFVETYPEYALDAALADAEFTAAPHLMAPTPEASKARRMVTDSVGWTLLVEKPQGTLAFILLVAPGGAVAEDASGLQLKRGSTTISLSGNRGMLLSGKGGFSAITIPEGWERDLVEEYRRRASAQPDLSIRQWVLDELRRHPASLLDQFVQKE